MATAYLTPFRISALGAALASLLLPVGTHASSVAAGDTSTLASASSQAAGAREVVIRYRSHTGAVRKAYVLLPGWYGGSRRPALPLVISPHGRGRDGRSNSHLWGDLPSIGGFAVVSPNGQGNHLPTMSWGAPGQI